LIEVFPPNLETLIVSKNRMSNIEVLIPVYRKLSETKIKDLTLDYMSSFAPPMFEDLLESLPHLSTISVCGFVDRAYEMTTKNTADRWLVIH